MRTGTHLSAAEASSSRDSRPCVNLTHVARGRILIALARHAIEQRLGPASAPPGDPADAVHVRWLDEPGATFVTLRIDGGLRGCVGSLAAVRPLRVDVRENALAAAFRDPRFGDLAVDEYSRTSVEVSLLTAPEPVEGITDEASAVAALRPGVDGVILHAGGILRSTFLPQVWEDLPDPARFLAELERKAGLPPGTWGPDYRLSRYQVEKFTEPAS